MEKEPIGIGHWIFAGIFAVVFISFIVFAYRKDLRRIKFHYRKVWLVLLLIIAIYFAIFFINRWT